MRRPHIKILVLPGGTLPERKSKGAAGLDVRIRALVCPDRMDESDPRLRATLFDFEHMPTEQSIALHVQEIARLDGQGKELAYVLHPGEVVVAGIGFITDTNSLSYDVRSRSGLAIKNGIVVEGDSIEMVTLVDPDYRGEAGVRVYNHGTEPILLRRGMRIAQIVFQKPVFPIFDVVEDAEEISHTEREARGFGSTGLL